VLFVLGPGCESEPPPRSRNVILLSIDTLRADHLGAYGYPRPTSPHFDALADRGTLFEEVVASSSWTIPSHATMLTGLYSSTHGVDGLHKVLPDDLPTLPEWFQNAGFETAAIVNARVLPHAQGRALFDHFEEISPNMRLARGTAPRVNQAVFDWLRRERESKRPFFLFLHYYDVHSDYIALPRFRVAFEEPYVGSARGTNEQLIDYFSRFLRHWGPAEARHLRNLYDSGIRQMDKRIQLLFKGLDRLGILDDTVVLLTSDHGEEFLEHGSVLHSRTLYEEQLRVPLLLIGPDIPQGLRVKGAVSNIDLAPTALALAGVESPAGLPGVDLRAAWLEPDRWPPDRALFAETDEWVGRVKGGFRRAIRRDGWKLLLDEPSGEIELYDLRRDPKEEQDRSGDEPAIRDRLREELRAFVERKQSSADRLEIDPKTAEELRALGYAP
jgi:arylsulfatase A-like enzyme